MVWFAARILELAIAWTYSCNNRDGSCAGATKGAAPNLPRRKLCFLWMVGLEVPVFGGIFNLARLHVGPPG